MSSALGLWLGTSREFRGRVPLYGRHAVLIRGIELRPDVRNWSRAVNTVGEYMFSELTWTADIVAALWSELPHNRKTCTTNSLSEIVKKGRRRS